MNHAPAPSISLEPGTSRDLDSVIAVMDAAFDDRFGEAWTRSQCAGILPMPGVKLVMARTADGNAVGFALLRTVADDAELLLLAVSPPFRRRGIGRMLLKHFLAYAGDAGASHLHLEVRDGNPAVDMYLAAGFSTAGRRRKYYRGRSGGEYDALTLTKKL